MIRNWLEKKKFLSKLAVYPACDHLNYTILFLLANPKENRAAIEEVVHVIFKAGGYFYDNVVDGLKTNEFFIHTEFPKVRKY